MKTQRDRTRGQRGKCCICGCAFEHEYDDHNAEPVETGRCCGDCNWMYVIPARLGITFKQLSTKQDTEN